MINCHISPNTSLGASIFTKGAIKPYHVIISKTHYKESIWKDSEPVIKCGPGSHIRADNRSYNKETYFYLNYVAYNINFSHKYE